MKKNIIGLLFLGSALFFAACSMATNATTAGGTTTGGTTTGGTTTGGTTTGGTGSVIVNNIGPYAKDIKLYTGTYADKATDRTVVGSLSVKAGATNVAWDFSKVKGNNLWYVADEGTAQEKTYFYSAAPKILLLLNLYDDVAYTLTLKSNYSSVGATLILETTDKRSVLDWDSRDFVSTQSFGTYTSLKNGNLVSPKINIINSPDWELDTDGAWLANNLITDTYSWIYGAIRLRYKGTGSRSFVNCTYRVRDTNNSIRYFDYNYGNGKTANASPTYISDCCVEKTGDIMRFLVIEDLKTIAMDLSMIKEIDLVISSDQMTSFTVPVGLTIIGNPAAESSRGYIPVQNASANSIKADSCPVYFKDSQSREYYWDYSQYHSNATGTWKLFQDAIPSKETGRMYFSWPNSRIFSETYSVGFVNLMWNTATSSLRNSFANGMISSEDIAKANRARILELRDEIDRAAGNTGITDYGAKSVRSR